MIVLQELRELARTFDDTSEGWSCKGTVLESRTINVDRRAFLFLGSKGDVRLKLQRSLPAARKLAAKRPDLYTVGSGGWTKICLGVDIPPRDLLESWIEESYALIAAGTTKAKPKAKAKRAPKKRKTR